MNDKYNPIGCGYSINVCGTVICLLTCTPCKEHCAKEKQDKAVSEMAMIIKQWEDGENDGTV